jgi:hypothetical protein
MDSAELVAELEANAEALRQQGVDVWVQRTRERVRSVTLRANGAKPASLMEESRRPALESAEIDAIVTDRYDASLTEEVIGKVDEVAERSGFTLESSNSEQAAPNEFATLDSITEHERSVLPMGVAALIAILALALILIFTVNRNGAFAAPVAGVTDTRTTSSAGSEVEAEGSAAPKAESDDDTSSAIDADPGGAQSGGGQKSVADSDFEKLMQQATKGRVAASQYALGRRYAEGRGVPADKVAAYAWLVVALNNGETRSERELQSLAPELSALEIQEIRMTLGDWYARGRGVQKDLIAAHKWYALAEVAGSAEGTVRKKALEAQMSPAQIEQAEESTTAWLSRH